jgi:multiple sugar transport system ATP-binding protein
MARVRIENVVKKFAGGVTAVDNVSLDIPDGKFVILVGPSGCGKTTLLRLLAGLEEASSGRILIGDKDVTKAHPRERDIAMVFQSYALYPHMSVRRNMGFALELQKVPSTEIDKRVANAANILGINPLLDRQPKQLSGGQRQRVALGRAIVREPAVFLFDEPLSNLDAKLRTAMRSELIKLHKRLGTTIVYVTHDQVEAMTMGQVVVVMKDGVVQQLGEPLEIYRNPKNLFVAEFIGSPAMNFLRANVHLSDRRGEADAGAITLSLDGRMLQEVNRAALAELVIGVRPEHLTLAPKGVIPGDRILIEGIVEVVEPLGAETILEFNCAGRSLVARLMGDDVPRAGEKIRLCTEPRQIFLFNANSGERLGFVEQSGSK